jgi:hypothetical protein
MMTAWLLPRIASREPPGGKAAPRCAAGGHPHALTGTIDVEDLLDVIFRDFCLGK